MKAIGIFKFIKLLFISMFLSITFNSCDFEMYPYNDVYDLDVNYVIKYGQPVYSNGVVVYYYYRNYYYYPYYRMDRLYFRRYSYPRYTYPRHYYGNVNTRRGDSNYTRSNRTTTINNNHDSRIRSNSNIQSNTRTRSTTTGSATISSSSGARRR